VSLLRNVQIFDGEALVRGDAVRWDGERIIEIGSGLRPRAGEEVLDGGGGTLLPGLIDAHTHVMAGSLEQALLFGVTTEIDMFAVPGVIAELKARVAAGAALADVRSAGTGVTVAGGHPTQLVERGVYPPFPTLGPGEDPAAFVAARLDEGSDHLKIFLDDGGVVGHPVPTLPAATVAELVAAAHARGVLVIVHPGDHAAAETAVAAGADGLAHVPLDRVVTAELAIRMAAHGTFVSPTLGAADAVGGRGGGPALAADPRFAPLLDPLSHTMLTMLDGNFPLGHGAHPDPVAAQHSVAVLREHGVPVLAGSDAGTLGVAHGVSLHHELALLVDCGMAPTEALTAATAAPAAAFGLADRGRIRAGYRADLLLVAGDPTTEITATADIAGVWQRGRATSARRR
jgi:imidazolonepropionase-like amidohydrolase